MFVTSNSTIQDSCHHIISDFYAIKLVFLCILCQIGKKPQYLLMALILWEGGEKEVELSRHFFPPSQKYLFRLWCASSPIRFLNTINCINVIHSQMDSEKNQPNHHRNIQQAYLAWSGFKGRGHQAASSLSSLPPTLSPLQNKLQGKAYKEGRTEQNREEMFLPPPDVVSL